MSFTYDGDTVFVKHKKDSDPFSVWSQFLVAIDGNIAQCKICQSVLRTTGSSTKGLHTHLASKHHIKIIPDQQPSSSTEQVSNEPNKDSFDIPLLIEEVERHPELWNSSKVSFHDRDKRVKSWFDVCGIVCEGFDTKDQQKKKDLCNKIMMKWKKIKKGYDNNLKRKAKSGLAADSGRPYMYGQQLSFLLTPRPKIEIESSFEKNDDEDYIEEFDEKPGRIKHFYDPLRRKTNEFESTFIDFVKTPIPQADTPVAENSDRSFFESVLPSIKDFTEDQRLELRCDILNTIKRLRTSAREQNYRCSPKNVSDHTLPSNVSYGTNQKTNSSNNLTESQFHLMKATAPPSKFYPEVIMHQTFLPPTSSSTPSTSDCSTLNRSKHLPIQYTEQQRPSLSQEQISDLNSKP